MRIVLVSQMYPGAGDPDLGTFVRQIDVAMRERGHDVRLAVLTSRAGGKRRWLTLAGRAVRDARRRRPDVVYAHFLFPTGLIGGLASRAPLVVTAHGQDVANIGTLPGVRRATQVVVRRAAAIIAVSDYLRRELETKLPEARGKTHVVDCGVDLERFRGRDRDEARAELSWQGDGRAFLCVGALSERKNVVRLANAFERLDGSARLAFVGDGPLRPQLENRDRIRLVGPVPHDEIPRWLAACDVLCQPSLVEPFGQSLIEAMACERSVVATRIGGPPEFVTPEAGVLVDPYDEEAIAEGMRRAASLPSPNTAARAAAAAHDVKLQAQRVEEILEAAVRGRRA